MRALRAFWARSLFNKLIIIVAAPLICCPLGLLVTTPEGATITVPVTATPTDGPSPTPAPSNTPRPSEAPEPSATPRPSEIPRPTADPGVAATREAERLAREVERAAPCQPGQIKGNRNSGIYHAPGQRDYEDTRENVQCFDSEVDAQSAGYRRAQR